MHSQQFFVRKRKTLIVAVGLLIMLGLLSFLLLRQEKPRFGVAEKCSAFSPLSERFDGPVSMQEMAQDATAVVIATIKDSTILKDSFYANDPTPSVRVSKVLKGELKGHEVIQICPGMGHANFPVSKNLNLLLFLGGKDGDKWVPLWGSAGIVPLNKDGHFELLEKLSEGPSSVSEEQLRALIK